MNSLPVFETKLSQIHFDSNFKVKLQKNNKLGENHSILPQDLSINWFLFFFTHKKQLKSGMAICWAADAKHSSPEKLVHLARQTEGVLYLTNSNTWLQHS